MCLDADTEPNECTQQLQKSYNQIQCIEELYILHDEWESLNTAGFDRAQVPVISNQVFWNISDGIKSPWWPCLQAVWCYE